jgi:hypothetical protein
MAKAVVLKVVLALFALPITCMTLCAFRVQPVHGWMMRHDCPFAMLTMDPPSHPIGVQQGPAKQHATAQMTIP